MNVFRILVMEGLLERLVGREEGVRDVGGVPEKVLQGAASL